MGFIRKLALVLGSAVLVAAVWVFVGPAPFRSAPFFADAGSPPAGRVVFITFDGVDDRDVSANWDRLKTRIRREGYFFGLRADSEEMRISNSAGRSMAGYRAIFTGKYERFCWTNECGQVVDRTLVDALFERGARPEEVALFASWSGIGFAAESKPRAARSIAFEPASGFGAVSVLGDRLERIAAGAAADRPNWPGSRRDRYTWEMAREYAIAGRPKFLYVSLVDADEFGHAGDFRAYADSVRSYETEAMNLIEKIEASPYGRDVSFVLSVDHGRGERDPTSHGWWVPGSDRIWAAVIPSRALRELGLRRSAGRVFRQVDLRPTLEFLLGAPLVPEREGEPLIGLASASPGEVGHEGGAPAEGDFRPKVARSPKR